MSKIVFGHNSGPKASQKMKISGKLSSGPPRLNLRPPGPQNDPKTNQDPKVSQHSYNYIYIYTYIPPSLLSSLGWSLTALF